MSQVCEFTGTRPLTGHKVSHSNHKTKMRQRPNLKSRQYFVEGLNTTVRIKISTRAIRTIDKHGGLAKALFKVKNAPLSPKLQKIKNRLVAQ